MLKLKSRAVLETPTTGLSRQLSKTGLTTNQDNNNNNNSNALSGIVVSGSARAAGEDDDEDEQNNHGQRQQQQQQQPVKQSIHRYPGAFSNQPRFAPSQQQTFQGNGGTFSQDFDVADYCTPADQQFELAGNVQYANNVVVQQANATNGGGNSQGAWGIQSYGGNSGGNTNNNNNNNGFDSAEGKENTSSSLYNNQSNVLNTIMTKQFGMRSPVPLSPMRHKRARLGHVQESPNVLDVINGNNNSSAGLSGLRFQHFSNSQQQMTPRGGGESSQGNGTNNYNMNYNNAFNSRENLTTTTTGINSRSSLQALQYSQGNTNNNNNGNRNSQQQNNMFKDALNGGGNSNNSQMMFEIPPIPPNRVAGENNNNRDAAAATNKQKKFVMQSPPIARNAFLPDEEQAKELPAHSRRRKNESDDDKVLLNMSEKDTITNNNQTETHQKMLRFRADFADLGLIAKGGFGKVSKVVHRLDGKMYAVKRTEKKLYGESEKNDALREVHAMSALSSLDSPNIVRYYASWMEYDHLYIQMELCERGCLKFGPDAKFTKNENEVLLVVRDIANALSQAHDSEERIAHMDVKPDNIFESSKNVYKLGDWGRATSTCSEKRRKLIGGTSEIDGDQRYLANEVLNDDFSNLAKSDVWSLGATALELLLGETLPLNGDKYRALRDGRSVNQNFEDFGMNEFSCSDEMKTLLKCMLAKEPESRPTASEIFYESSRLLNL